MNEVERYDTRKNETGQPAEVEELYESFFGEGTEEERLRIRELAAKLNIRDNDALWIIIYVMNYFGRFYRDLPNKIRESSDACLENIQITAAKICEAEVRKSQELFTEILARSAEEILERHKKKTWLYDMFLPLSWTCMGIFCLCLISFTGGAAISRREHPLADLMSIPAGWIVPLALIPAAGFAVYRGLLESGWKRYLSLGASIVMIVLFLIVLQYVLL